MIDSKLANVKKRTMARHVDGQPPRQTRVAYKTVSNGTVLARVYGAHGDDGSRPEQSIVKRSGRSYFVQCD